MRSHRGSRRSFGAYVSSDFRFPTIRRRRSLRTPGVDRDTAARWERWTFGALRPASWPPPAGLAVAELASAASDALQSPVLDVGDRVVDSVPNSIKTLAIDWFGTKDKVALLIGIGVVLASTPPRSGVLALTRFWRLAIAGAAAVRVVGAYASQSTRRAAPWWAVAPSIVGGLVAALALLALRRALLGRGAAGDARRPERTRRQRRSRDRPPPLPARDRRHRGRHARRSARPACVWRPDPTSPTNADAAAAPAARGRCRRSSPARRRASPACRRSSRPNADFYRIDTALTVPQVSVDSWELTITGMVDRAADALVRRPDLAARSSRPTSRSRASRTRSAASWSATPAGSACGSTTCSTKPASTRPPTRSSAAPSTATRAGSRSPRSTAATRWSRSA